MSAIPPKSCPSRDRLLITLSVGCAALGQNTCGKHGASALPCGNKQLKIVAGRYPRLTNPAVRTPVVSVKPDPVIVALINCYLEIWSEHPIKAEHQAGGALKILRSFLRSITE